MKSSEKCSSCFRKEDVSKLRDFIHVYSPGARVDNTGVGIFVVTNSVCHFDHIL